jgi:hypothetical protein
MTLPTDVVRGLRRVNPDLAWAVVSLVRGTARSPLSPPRRADADLIEISNGRSLIVVKHDVIKHLPGVEVIQLQPGAAFFALQSGRGIADLEVAVLDRLASGMASPREQRALEQLRTQLRKWRNSRTLKCETHAILVLERARPATA